MMRIFKDQRLLLPALRIRPDLGRRRDPARGRARRTGSAAGLVPGHRLCRGCPADPRDVLLRLPRDEEAEGRPPPRREGGGLAGGSDGVEAIRPGQGAESELVRRVASRDPEERMPPEGDRLTADQVGILRAWIDQGASWPEDPSARRREPRRHWAFRPPVRPPVPQVSEPGLGAEPDRRASSSPGSRRRGSRPRPRPTGSTLLRRLSLDLIGLPPTIEEVDAFLADTARRRLRAGWSSGCSPRPHYGERWGRHWLDAARYADSDGYEKDKSRQVWFYRDWVINAFNRDLPYDQFIIEQIAGDLLPERDAGPDRRHRLPPQLDDQRGGRASTPSSSAWRRCSTAWTPSARASSA